MTIELLKKLKENKCTDKELHEIYRWLASPEKEVEATAFLKSSWRESYSTENGFEDLASVSKMRKEIWNQIGNQNGLRQNSKGPTTSNIVNDDSGFFRGWMKAAAVIALLVCAGMVFWFTNGASDTTEQVASITYVEKSNPRGQKSTVFLKDGSKVILNSSSSIKYKSNFGQDNRDIELVGEAFFEVTKNEQLPFNVVSGDLTTTALGTSFNIKAYPTQQYVQVSLVSGRAKTLLIGTSQAEFLEPGQSLEYDGKDGEMNKLSFDSKEELSWKEGILYFENKKFEEVVTLLEEWYDVEINLNYGNQTKSKYDDVNGEFKNESLENVLKVMSHARDFDYKIGGKTVNIQFK
ncbi:MAG: transmembrane sensor [Cyclobacteriaceae bacterium]|jgi:ferric-dicitrate binding protein FerR (iron transport regulator)